MQAWLERHRAAANGLRWVLYLAVSWIILRPALLVTISGDDLINPFDLYQRYGSNPLRLASKMSRDVLRNGHFNVFGQTLGAWVVTVWGYLISSGVRFSLIYATTKFVVIVGCAVAAGRLLRTLGSLIGWQVTVWRARLLVSAVLLLTIQVHIPWSADPVGSFPLWGYLPAMLGLLAIDVAVRALDGGSTRRCLLAAAALAGAILYYEINVAAVVALVPAVVLFIARSGGHRRHVVRSTLLVIGPPTVMSLVLIAVARQANRGYSGTDVDVGGVGPGLVARTVGGSLPGSAWGAARDWLGTSFDVSAAAVLSAVVVAAVIVWIAWQPRPAGPSAPWWQVLLIAAVPAVLWLAATAIQTATSRIDVSTTQLGFVYTYYAYGSVGVALAAIVAVQALPRGAAWRWAKPLLVVGAIAFATVQLVVNDSVVRAFGDRLAVTNRLLVVVSDDPPEAQRCAALGAWVAGTPFLLGYYHRSMVDGLNVAWKDRHGELFCGTDVLSAGT